ncbi:MAG: DUF2075 domain-containing protein [Methanomassiliicoccaceae archaeon]|nr:DUF2075 domain-containing protein [Methanomassiliicoccaceae archaeon]
MIIYENTKKGFSHDILEGMIEKRITEAIYEKTGRTTARSEIRSWMNSLEYMDNVLNDDDIPNNSGIAIEYNIPFSSKRVDMIISGLDEREKPVAVIVELKQWESADKVEGEDGIVRTFLGGGLNRTTHPSYQAWSYAKTISNFNRNVQEIPITLSPCAFLHNYVVIDGNDPLTDPQYREYTDQAPVFTRRDKVKLREFIKRYIRHGDNKGTLYLIDNGELRPSKSLQDSLVRMLEGNEEFVMLDSQKVVLEKILRAAKDSKRDGSKRVLIVEGGPGTGKSVLAVNALVKMTAEGLVATYVTKNQAPRHVYSTKLKGTRIPGATDNMFRGSGGFYKAEENVFDAILADEAHRLNEKSGLYQNLGENQIKEIINASKFTVFFIDESQRVTLKDIGTIDNILSAAGEAGAEVIGIDELDSQFRCGGSDGYMAWLDDVLGIKETANFDRIDNSYDIRIFRDPNELLMAIKEKNIVRNRSRMVAGYCWNWISEGKNRSDVHDITIPEFGFGMSWNLGSTNTWAIDPDSVKEAGCIHTCQGLEFDYVGVIMGDDLRYENGEIVTDHMKRARTDQSLRGLRTEYPNSKEAAVAADSIIKNTYRTLMSRGMEGCYVFCTDERLGEYLEERIAMFRKGVI